MRRLLVYCAGSVNRLRDLSKRKGLLLLLSAVLPLFLLALCLINLHSPILAADAAHIDARGAAHGGPYMLTGHWRMWEGLYEPDALAAVDSRLSEDVRSMNRMEGNTYRFTLSAPSDVELWFLLPRPHSSRLWINGQEALGNGSLSINSADAFRLLDYGAAPYVFTLHVKGSTPYFGYQGILLGTYAQVSRVQTRWMVLDIFAIGLEAMLILICMILFLHKRSEKYLLLLSLCAITNALHFMLVPRHPMLLGLGIGNAVAFRYLAFLYYFACREFLPKAIFRHTDRIVYGTAAVSLALLALFPRSVSGVIRAASILYLSIQFGCIARGLLLGVREAPALLLGNALALSNELFYALMAAGLVPSGVLDVEIMPAQYALVFYIIAFTVATCQKFSRKFKEAERLSADLERRVLVKTQALRDANRRMLSIQAQKQKFMTGIVHNLRNPLFALGGYVDLLQDEMESCTPQQRQYLNLINDKITYLGKMSTDLVLAAKLEEGRLRFHYSRVDLASLLKSAAEDAIAKTSRKRIRIPVACGAVTLTVDPYLLRQALDNLLDNAIRFSEDGGQVEIAGHLDCEKATACITVQDHGPGLDPALIEQIARGAAREKSAAPAGYGLYIACGLIEAQGGTVSAASAKGEGTRFTLCLPLQAPEAKEPEAEEPV